MEQSVIDWFEEQGETPRKTHQAINQVLVEHMRRVRFPDRKADREADREATGWRPTPM